VFIPGKIKLLLRLVIYPGLDEGWTRQAGEKRSWHI